MAVVMTVLSQSGFGPPDEVVCLGGSVAPVGFVSLWSFTDSDIASVAISRLDSASLSAIIILSVSG